MSEGPRQSNQVFAGQQPPQHPQHAQQQPVSQPPPVVPGSTPEYVPVDDLGYQVPVDTVPLPSRGLCYPTTSVLHGQDKIDIRAMTAKDEDILTSRALIKKGTVISHLLRSCIVDKRVNPNELLSGDRNAILVALRITGYGPQYVVEIQCPSCGHKEATDFDLSDMEIKWLDIEPLAKGENIFQMQLPVSKKQLRFRFLTGKDEEELALDLETRKKKLKTSMDNLITSRLHRSIVAVDGREDRGFISKFINNMPVGDSRALRKFIEEHEPGIDMSATHMCSSCDAVNEVEVPIGASFFWPDA